MRIGYEIISHAESLDLICEKNIAAVTSMICAYKITPDEWPLMKLESPEIWKRIEEIEWFGPRTIEQTRLDMEILLKNYDRLFTRRVNRRVTAA
jgi:hypothetical protein